MRKQEREAVEELLESLDWEAEIVGPCEWTLRFGEWLPDDEGEKRGIGIRVREDDPWNVFDDIDEALQWVESMALGELDAMDVMDTRIEG